MALILELQRPSRSHTLPKSQSNRSCSRSAEVHHKHVADKSAATTCMSRLSCQHGSESIGIVPKIMLNQCPILYRNPGYSGGKVCPTQFQKMYLIKWPVSVCWLFHYTVLPHYIALCLTCVRSSSIYLFLTLQLYSILLQTVRICSDLFLYIHLSVMFPSIWVMKC